MKGFIKFTVKLLQRVVSTRFYLQKNNIKTLVSYFVLDNQATYWENNYIFYLITVSLNNVRYRLSDRTLQVACCSINNFDRTDGKIFKHLNKLSAHLCCERKLRTWIHQCTVNLRGKSCFQLTLQFRWNLCSLDIPDNPSRIFIATVVGLLTNSHPYIIQQS